MHTHIYVELVMAYFMIVIIGLGPRLLTKFAKKSAKKVETRE